MRLEVAVTEDDRDRVKAYADKHGLRMPRAYADLIRAGLDAESEG